jgi:hypothetical protein
MYIGSWWLMFWDNILVLSSNECLTNEDMNNILSRNIGDLHCATPRKNKYLNQTMVEAWDLKFLT